MLNIGVQVSSAGKIYYSADQAKKLGCSCMQIFARNPRQWRKCSLDKENIRIFRQRVKAAGIKPVVVHIPYTLNLATAQHKFYRITIREFTEDLIEADKLRADYLVTHMGSHKGISREQGLVKIFKALRKILKKTEGVKTKILLENTSGSGQWLGYVFSQHRYILENLEWTPRVGLCLDTAHAWAAGYKIDCCQGVDDLLDEIDEQVGLARLKVIHLNDTQEDFGSRHDRHFDIGEGKIGKQGFSSLINSSRLKKVAFILETPKKDDEDDLRNLNAARSLYDNKVFQGNR